MSPSAYTARARAPDLLHAAVPRAPRSARRARGQRHRGVAHRDLEGVSAHAARAARPAVPARARHPPPVAGARGGATGCAFRSSSSRTSAAAAPASSGSTRRTALERAARRGTLDLGIDSTALVQEYMPAADGRIVRVEVLDGRYLYAIRIYTPRRQLQPVPGGRLPGRRRRRAGAAGVPGGRAEEQPARRGATRRRPRSSRRSSASWRASGIELGGVEYMIDERDGRPYFYDINALSNFVADAPRVVGFDPFARLADWLEAELRRAARVGDGRGGGVMRFGYWLPVFGGWLRNVDDEGMEATLGVRQPARAAQRADRLRPDAGRRAEPERHQGRRGAVARRLEHGRRARRGHRAAGDHGGGAARRSTRRRCSPSRPPTSTTSAAAGCRSTSCRRGGRRRRGMYGVPFDQHDDRYARTPSGSTSSTACGSEPVVLVRGRVLPGRRHGARAEAGARPRPTHLRGRRVAGGQGADRRASATRS